MSDIDITEAIRNPSSVFNEPEDVLAAHIKHDDKIKILQSWAYDLRDLQVAEEENMGDGESSHTGLLSRIHHLLDQLDVGEESTGSKH